MLRAFGCACLSPFRHPGSALLVTFVMIGLPMAMLIAMAAIEYFSLTGTAFFSPDGTGDPVLFQHLLWITGHPETMRLVLAVSLLFFGPLAYAIWWRALEGAKERLRLASLGRVAVWVWAAMSALLLAGFYFALVPGSAPSVDGIVLFLAVLLAWILLARFQPRIAAALGAEQTQALGWGIAVGAAALIVVLGVVAQTSGLFAWMGLTGLGSQAFYNPESAWARLMVQALLLDWQSITMLLAFAYTALVALAFLRDLPGTER